MVLMLYDDVTYMERLSTSLDHCVRRGQYVWNFRCPICGDSERNSSKTRGYVYPSVDHLSYKCHNCGLSTSFYHLLKLVSPPLFSEYNLNRYRPQSSTGIMRLLEKPSTPEVFDAVLDTLNLVSTLPESHEAVRYLMSRRVPRHTWRYLYHADDFNGWLDHLNLPKYILNDLGVHPRLILPILDQHGRVGSVSARAYPGTKAEKVKRYTKVTFDPSMPSVFGMDRVAFNKKIVVVEGQLDSLFLTNAVAVEGSTLDIGWVRDIKSNVILVQDNEPRNKQIVSHLRGYIASGYQVTIFPIWVSGKDINEMILHGMSLDAINNMVHRYSFHGLEAEIRFSEWVNT